ITAAYETLCDTSRRRAYDAELEAAQNFPGGFTGEEDDEGGLPFDMANDIFIRNMWEDFMRTQLRQRRERAEQAAAAAAAAAYASYEEDYQPHETKEQRQQRRRDIRDRLDQEAKEEVERRRGQLAAERAARDALNKSPTAAAAQDEEAKKQAALWQRLGAVTKDERLATCLHSNHCDKITQPKKFKCFSCGVKRGKIAFLCPHCAAHLCQLCVEQYAKKRAHDMKQMDTPKAKAEEAHNHIHHGGQASGGKKMPATFSSTTKQANGGAAPGRPPKTTTQGNGNGNPTPKAETTAPCGSQSQTDPEHNQKFSRRKRSIQKGRQRQHPAGENPNGKFCYGCGKDDHLASNCPEPRNSSRGLCFVCRQPGHLAAVCPLRQ
ncbi:hypothetical protein GGR50DRAFT_705148, partial [Xylaria sp. CBS 124048]